MSFDDDHQDSNRTSCRTIPENEAEKTSLRKDSSLQAVYLTGEHVYLRAMMLSDKDHATAWFNSPYPINASRAEAILKDQHNQLFSRTFYLVIVRRATDETIGGMTLLTNGRGADLWFTMAPWLDDADAMRADALRVVIPWLRDEATMAATDVLIASDEVETIKAAEELGMTLGVRLREHITRPGYRADQLVYQAFGAAWVFDKETANA